MSFRAPGPARPPTARARLASGRWARRLALVLAVIAAVTVLVVVCARMWTDYLWLRSVGDPSVFAITYGTQWALFAVAGSAVAAAVWLNAALAFRLRPSYRPRSGRGAYRVAVDLHRRLLLALALVTIGGACGAAAASQWRTWLLFAHRAHFGRVDPQFHIDISFFVFVYPFIRLVLGYLFALVLACLTAAVSVHALYGGLRWQRWRPAATRAAQAHVFLLVGVFMLIKSAAYWSDRYGIDFSRRGAVGTGASFVDVSAVLPAKTVLAVIALLCAGLFFAGSLLRRALLPAVGFCLLALSAVLLGGVYPLAISQFVVKPNELAKESRYIQRQITATRQAYGVTGARVISYPGAGARTLIQAAAQAAEAQLMDPSVMARTFTQLQQVKGYYQFPGTLSVDRYLLPGAGSTPQDVIVAVRGISGPPHGQDTWVNAHLVYTHGYGFVAARADVAQPPPSGQPVFVEGGIPAGGSLRVGWYQPRVYFGPQQNGYVIVGGPPGRPGQEFDYPTVGGQRRYTYAGTGGVPVGSLLDRLAYAVKFGQLNIALSDAANSRSRILYDRQPLARVAAIAPFLTLDRHPYPVVANHRILWVVDGYTTTDLYPYSERIDLAQATSTSRSPAGTAAARSGAQVNYLRNSVKAVVDAYTGAVTLYQWGPPDPLLRAWARAFPGLIKPRRDIPGYLLGHLRYPQALFEAQRQILTRYHVVDAASLYGGQDAWSVPADPGGPAGRQPPSYLTLSMPGYRRPQFSLSSTFVASGRAGLAAFMAVDADPTQPGYGAIEILRLPQDAAVPGPAQAHAAFTSFPQAAAELAAWRRDGSRVAFGSLVTLPVDGALLYLQPVYTSPGGRGAAFPTLRRVFVYYPGLPQPVGYAATVPGALAQVFGAGQQFGGGQAGPVSAEVRSDLNLAEQYYAQALTAFGKGDFAAFGKALARMKQAIDDARALAEAGQGAPASPLSSATSARPRAG